MRDGRAWALGLVYADGMDDTTLIRGGTVVTADAAHRADVLVRGATVAAVGLDLPAPAGASVVDAGGLLVLPGGVDPHVHLQMDAGRCQTADDWPTGTAAAVAGGTTTVLDFANQEQGRSPLDALATWRARADGRTWADYGLHVTITDLPAPRVDVLDELAEAGVTSYKLFQAYPGRLFTDDATRFRVFQRAAENRCLVMIHAESGLVIDELVAQAVAAGHTTPPWHARTRPPELAAESVHRSAVLAGLTGVRLYIVHMNSSEGLDALRHARDAGVDILGETCPHYLLLDEARLEGPDGPHFVCSPPLRPAWHADVLWRALADGELATVATDHAPFRAEDRLADLSDFRRIPNGLGGIEERLALLWHFGVVERGLSPSRFVALTSTHAARIFGLPTKGTVAPGADADLVLWDPARSQTLGHGRSAATPSPWEGLEVSGGPQSVWLRGQPVVREGELVGEPRGRYLSRARAT